MKKGRLPIRARPLTLVASLALVAGLSTGVVAMAQSEGPELFTGCLLTADPTDSPGKTQPGAAAGTIRKVAMGGEPLRPCATNETQITWDRAGPPFTGQIEALDARVSSLEERLDLLALYVDCGAGDTVSAALDAAAGHIGPVVITIAGVCTENVGVNRSDVTLVGSTPDSGLTAGVEASTVFVGDAERVGLRDLTINAGNAGIEGAPGSSFQAVGVTVQGAATWGVLAGPGSAADVRNSVIQDGQGFGITARAGAVYLQDTLVQRNVDGVHAESGGDVTGFGVESTGNSRNGVVAAFGGTVSLVDSTVSGNSDFGVHVLSNGTASVVSTLVEDNGADGLQAGQNSVVHVGDSTVQGNLNGVTAAQASTVVLFGSTIADNTFDGIRLDDQANGTGGPGSTISGNGGFGISCAGPAGFPEVQNGFDLPAITFIDNAAGSTNCP